MKQLLLLFILISLHLNASANCALGNLQAFPKNQELNQGAMIVLEGYGMVQEIILGLNKKYPVYIKSGTHRVELEVVETCVGARRVAQIFLRPTAQLELGETYELGIDRLAKEEERWLMPWDAKQQQRKTISWTISAAEMAKPAWEQMPQLKEVSAMRLGCGPSVHATFTMAVTDAKTTLVETELMDLETKETQHYYLLIREGRLLNVGHGMCSGAFNYQPEHRYQVRFKLANLKGEKTKNWTNWIAYNSPYEALAVNKY